MAEEVFRVSFIGHREIFQGWMQMGCILHEFVRTLMQNKKNVEFYVGENGDFDRMAAAVVRDEQKRQKNKNAKLILVRAYKGVGKKARPWEYDAIYVPTDETGHYKGAISRRNEYMMDMSDFVIAYVTKAGGAKRALDYAKKKGKAYFNLVHICT